MDNVWGSAQSDAGLDTGRGPAGKLVDMGLGTLIGDVGGVVEQVINRCHPER